MKNSNLRSKKIKTINEYLDVLTKIPKVDDNEERFYRGLNNQKFYDSDCPSIYRNVVKQKGKKKLESKAYINYEEKIFHDLISKVPEKFSQCNNAFECLTVMQHYGAPTRLLDVTTNPLIALYFACADAENTSFSNGAIAIYDMPQKNIKNFGSDTVTILSNLARIDCEFTPFFILLNKYINDIKLDNQKKYMIESHTEDVFNKFENLNKCYVEIQKKESLLKNDKNFGLKMNLLKDNIISYRKHYKLAFTFENDFRDDTIKVNGMSKIQKNAFRNLNKIYVSFINLVNTLTIDDKSIKFKNFILEEKAYFKYELINEKDLIDAFCVKPKLNSPRIINQNGAFLISGFKSITDSKLEQPKHHFEYRPKLMIDGKEYSKIEIPKSSKETILNELKLFGIDRSFVYPEIENISKVITNKYQIFS